MLPEKEVSGMPSPFASLNVLMNKTGPESVQVGGFWSAHVAGSIDRTKYAMENAMAHFPSNAGILKFRLMTCPPLNRSTRSKRTSYRRRSSHGPPRQRRNFADGIPTSKAFHPVGRTG
jgi:hypothetical protein